MNILFVCTGNTCRSSMAEGIFRKLLEMNNMGNINVSSAGISAFEGDSANEKAVDVMAEKGIDISDHRSRRLTEEIISKSDLVLTMTINHKNMILNALPQYSHRVYTLKEYAQAEGNPDIADPYGLGYNDYLRTAEEIEMYLKKIIDNIKTTN